jgi:hypothetical protein
MAQAQRWEYLQYWEAGDIPHQDKALESGSTLRRLGELDALGEQGWELVAVDLGHNAFHFKRPKP